jgi:hypothetical protein
MVNRERIDTGRNGRKWSSRVRHGYSFGAFLRDFSPFRPKRMVKNEMAVVSSTPCQCFVRNTLYLTIPTGCQRVAYIHNTGRAQELSCKYIVKVSIVRPSVRATRVQGTTKCSRHRDSEVLVARVNQTRDNEEHENIHDSESRCLQNSDRRKREVEQNSERRK